MSGKFVAVPSQILGLSPASSTVSANTQVSAQAGPLALTTDTVLFADGGTGMWSLGATRVTVNGTAVVTSGGVGTSTHPVGTAVVTSPLSVVPGELLLEGQ